MSKSVRSSLVYARRIEHAVALTVANNTQVGGKFINRAIKEVAGNLGKKISIQGTHFALYSTGTGKVVINLVVNKVPFTVTLRPSFLTAFNPLKYGMRIKRNTANQGNDSPIESEARMECARIVSEALSTYEACPAVAL